MAAGATRDPLAACDPPAAPAARGDCTWAAHKTRTWDPWDPAAARGRGGLRPRFGAQVAGGLCKRSTDGHFRTGLLATGLRSRDAGGYRCTEPGSVHSLSLPRSPLLLCASHQHVGGHQHVGRPRHQPWVVQVINTWAVHVISTWVVYVIRMWVVHIINTCVVLGFSQSAQTTLGSRPPAWPWWSGAAGTPPGPCPAQSSPREPRWSWVRGLSPPQTLSAPSSPSVLEPKGQSAEVFAGEKAATGRASWPPKAPVQGPRHSEEHHQVCTTLSLPCYTWGEIHGDPRILYTDVD